MRHIYLITVLTVFLSGCDAWHSGTAPVDPPPFAEEQMKPQKNGLLTVVWSDAEGSLVPVTVPGLLGTAGEGNDMLKAVNRMLKWMSTDGIQTAMLPEGFYPVLPQGLQARSAVLDRTKQMLSVDLNEALYALPAGSERRALEALAWSLTGIDGVGSVMLTVADQPVVVLPAGGTPVARPLTRAIGLNLDPSGASLTGNDSVEMGWIRVDVRKQNAEGYPYTVPVWRWLERSLDRPQAEAAEWADPAMPVTELADAAFEPVNRWMWSDQPAIGLPE